MKQQRVDWEAITIFWAIVAVAAIGLVGMSIDEAIKRWAESSEKTEAIKAGLVQNEKGHWVKP